MKIKLINNTKFILFFLIIIMSFVCPFYIEKNNIHNLSFTMVEIPGFILVLVFLIEKIKINKLYSFFILLYFISFLYINITYLSCYWPMLYKTACFIILGASQSYDFDNPKVKYFFETVLKYGIYVFTFSTLAAIFFRLLGIDSIALNITDIGYRLNGFYADNRMTWVFGHKSIFAMLDIFMIYFSLHIKKLSYRKEILAILFIALILINSVTGLCGACIILVYYYINDVKGNGGRKTRILIVMILGGLILACGIWGVSRVRDIFSLGYRVYLWGAIPDILNEYPHGLGHEFFDTYWWVKGGATFNGVMAQNFHNVYFNECLHYSVIVGILYFVLIIFYPIKAIFSSKRKITNFILFISLMLPSFFDMAENDNMFLIWMMMILAFGVSIESNNKGKISGEI